MAFRSTDPTTEDCEMPDDFAEGIEASASTRKKNAPEANKKTKTKRKSDEMETLIDELEKRSCLWDIFDKEYHNREKREIAYTELQDILKHTKQDIKTKL